MDFRVTNITDDGLKEVFRGLQTKKGSKLKELELFMRKNVNLSFTYFYIVSSNVTAKSIEFLADFFTTIGNVKKDDPIWKRTTLNYIRINHENYYTNDGSVMDKLVLAL